MIVYEGTKRSFIEDVNTNKISIKVYVEYQKHFGKTTDSQIRAWQNSMQYMRGVIDDREIPDDSGVAIEYNIPATSKRIDFIISGSKEDKSKSVIIIELKQWENCNLVENKDGVVETYIGGGMHETAHPSYQALSYAHYIDDYNDATETKNINLFPCAFLHNYVIQKDSPIINEHYKEYIEAAPVFGAENFVELRNFIKKHIQRGDNCKTIYEIEYGHFRPSKSLQDVLASMINGNKEFDLIDDQKVAYEEAMNMAKNSIMTGEKSVLIVNGGPGTGKTVLAMNLMVDLINKNVSCFYVTKNSAPRNVFKKKLIGTKTKAFIDTCFQSSGAFIDLRNNQIDSLIVDEAHRLNEKSGMFSNLGENQIKEIINASKFSVFFIDERQRVTLKDIGTSDLIKKFAYEANAKVKEMELESQFRCNGSDGYLSWLDSVLNIKVTANFDNMDYDYDFRVFDDPNELRKAIERKNTNNKARMVAGYCWDWISQGKNDSTIHDIIIPKYGFSMSWNLGNSSTWAIDPDSINEIGCIHTCQGLEFDYVGVIIGDDLRYEDGNIITDYTKRASTDSSLKGIKKLLRENPEEAEKIADEIIKNTYRTLMTRGMKGCYVYCTDEKLSQYLKNKIKILKDR